MKIVLVGAGSEICLVAIDEKAFAYVTEAAEKFVQELFQTEGRTDRALPKGMTSAKKWADRTLFKKILEHYSLLPITGDSHFGEYIPWAHEVADHKDIKDFCTLYQMMLSQVQPRIELKLCERLVIPQRSESSPSMVMLQLPSECWESKVR